jgi:hypothetical protein
VHEEILIARRGTQLFSVKGKSLFFSPDDQKVFLASPFSVGIWPHLVLGMTRNDFMQRANTAGLPGPDTASALLEAGIIDVVGTVDGSAPIVDRAFLDVAGLSVGLNFAGHQLIQLASDVFGYLKTTSRRCDEQIVLLETDGQCGIALLGKQVLWRSWEEAAPILKAAVTELVLEYQKSLVLHAALLSRSTSAILLAGGPGAGKSTLAIALAECGFQLECDDVTSLRCDGRVLALPLPITVKEGAWPLLRKFRPDMLEKPIFTRPDRQRVRYVELEQEDRPFPKDVRCILSLCRNGTPPAGLTCLNLEESIAVLLDGAWSRSKRLAPNDFVALMSCIKDAVSYRLTYSDLDEAIELAQLAWQRAISAQPRST